MTAQGSEQENEARAGRAMVGSKNANLFSGMGNREREGYMGKGRSGILGRGLV